MRKYTVGINVNTVDELSGMGTKVRAFLDEIGDGDLDLQLAINAHGNGGNLTRAIGFVTDDSEYDDDDEDYEDDEEDDE